MQQNNMATKESLLAKYILETNNTIRQTAQHFSMSKSNVHHYVSERLKKTDHLLYRKLQVILNQHFEEKHIHGGEATKQKYLKAKSLTQKREA